MTNVLQALSRFFRALTATILGMLLIVIVLAVVDRYVLHLSLYWTDELARFLLIWGSLAGATVLTEKSGHLRVDLLDLLVQPRARSVLRLAALGMSLLFFVALTVYGGLLVGGTWEQASPALQIPMGLVYLAAPVSGSAMLLFALRDMTAEFSRLARRAER